MDRWACARLKNEFTDDETNYNLMRWLNNKLTYEPNKGPGELNIGRHDGHLTHILVFL